MSMLPRSSGRSMPRQCSRQRVSMTKRPRQGHLTCERSPMGSAGNDAEWMRGERGRQCRPSSCHERVRREEAKERERERDEESE